MPRLVRLPHRPFVAALRLPDARDRRGRPLRFRRTALLAIQRSAEQHIIRLLQAAEELARRARRMTVTHADFHAAIQLQ